MSDGIQRFERRELPVRPGHVTTLGRGRTR